MRRTHALLTLVPLLLAFLLPASAGHTPATDAWEPLLGAVHDILAGRPIAEPAVRIAPDAYVAAGSAYENLAAVAAGKDSVLSLREEGTRQDASIVVKIDDTGDSAFLVLRTTARGGAEARFHTVVFMKDTEGRWTIDAWHASR